MKMHAIIETVQFVVVDGWAALGVIRCGGHRNSVVITQAGQAFVNIRALFELINHIWEKLKV